jgi:two-component system chemotaxis sensor kinase CheA
MMDEIQAALIETFLEEAAELLTDLEGALLALEKDPENREVIDRVFRVMHTLKGNAAMFGFDRVEMFTHDIETVYDMVRDGELAVTGELVDLTLAAGDLISALLGAEKEESSSDVAEKILVRFKELAAVSGKSRPIRAADTFLPAVDNRVMSTYRIRFAPNREIFTSGTNPLGIIRELQGLGTCIISADTRNLPALGRIKPESCYLSWNILLNTEAGLDRIKDAFIFVEDLADIAIEEVDGPGSAWEGDIQKRLGDILVERGEVSRQELEQVLGGHQKLGEDLVEQGLVDPEVVEEALAEQEMIQEARSSRSGTDSAASVRVASAKLDGLVDLVGELVTVQARLTQMVSDNSDPDMIAVAEEIESLTWELRDNAFSIRVIPIGTAFSRIQRLVRDLSRDLGQKVELVTEGGDTELDKTVIEKLTDPLMHLIRNSVDHGLESPEERAELGKPDTGVITLSAYQAGADVVVRVTDDGRGIDIEAVRRKAVLGGLITPDQELPDDELFSLLFSSGFSTAESVTSVSGRGVGLDVVRQSIDNLRGKVQLSSTPGEGTAFTIRLPLTLAIIDGLLMELGQEKYIVPLQSVEECVQLGAVDRQKSHGRNVIDVRGELVPFEPEGMVQR